MKGKRNGSEKNIKKQSQKRKKRCAEPLKIAKINHYSLKSYYLFSVQLLWVLFFPPCSNCCLRHMTALRLEQKGSSVSTSMNTSAL